MRERIMFPPDNMLEETETKDDKAPLDLNERQLRKKYGKEASQYDLLTREEEQELAKKIQNGDAKAREQFINSNLRLVISIANKLTSDEKILSDLIQEGNIGLIKAVEKFDPERGNRFNTMAREWILSYMKNYVIYTKSLVKIGTTQVQRRIFSNLKKIERELAKEGIDNADDEMIAKRMGDEEVTAQEIQNMRQRLRPILSIDTPISFDNPNTLKDLLKAPTASPEEIAQKNEITKIIQEVLSTIKNDRHRAIIEDHLLGDKSLTQIGVEFNLSRERMRQIEIELKEKLAKILEQKGLKDYE